jgi:hypothetical protein
MGIILGQIVFNLLHHLEKVIEADEIGISFALRPNLLEELLGFLGISLETLHNGFQILDIN